MPKIKNVSKSDYVIPGAIVRPGQVVDLDGKNVSDKVKKLHVDYPADWQLVGAEKEVELAAAPAPKEAEEKPKGKAKG